MTILYSVLHLLVDGLCAFAMFGRFLPRGNAAIDLILYNFCAFALQMPFGVILDILERKPAAKSGFRTYSHFAAVSGVLFTILGTVTHPVLLGIGNALFHIGGGVGTIHEDRTRNRKGWGLGIFVAPGALGLYLGALAAKNGLGNTALWTLSILMILLCAAASVIQRNDHMGRIKTHSSGHIPDSAIRIISAVQGAETRICHKKLYLLICCLLVVILRSYIGIAVTFPWKTTISGRLLAVLAVVSGKMAGGFLAAKYGVRPTCVFSLIMAAVTYTCPSVMPIGIMALLLFNMTMPVTLYLLICQFPQMPGFSFGLLTFGLFLGFLPEYFGLPLMAEGKMIGSMGSILSLLLLLAGMYCSRTHYDTVQKGMAERRLH